MPQENPIVSNITPSIIKVPNLTNKAIIISVSTGAFGTQKKDQKASNQIAIDNNNNAKVARVTKTLMSGREFKDITNQRQKITQIYHKATSEWKKGERILRIRDYIKTKQDLEDAVREFYKLVDVAVDNLDMIINEDQRQLGNLFNPSDYPDKSRFRSYFYAKISVGEVEKNDFRSSILSDEENEEINNQIAERIDEAIKNSKRDIFNRVFEKASKLIERLDATEGKFHASAVSNVIEAIAEARKLNIDEDKTVEDILDQVENSISNIDAESVRGSEVVRASALASSKEAVNKIVDSMEDLGL